MKKIKKRIDGEFSARLAAMIAKWKGFAQLPMRLIDTNLLFSSKTNSNVPYTPLFRTTERNTLAGK